jgi:hypothetical protein
MPFLCPHSRKPQASILRSFSDVACACVCSGSAFDGEPRLVLAASVRPLEALQLPPKLQEHRFYRRVRSHGFTDSLPLTAHHSSHTHYMCLVLREQA